MELLGYHGTDKRHYCAIKAENFMASRGRDHWLGNGAYFFIEGVSRCPKEDAEEWAHVESYDRGTKVKKYPEFCVIEAKIELKNPLDLRDREIVREFNSMRLEFMSRIEKRIFGRIYDPDVISVLTHSLDLDGVIADLFFRVKAMDRKKRTDSRIPNCTVLCVVKPQSAISLDSIASHLEGPADHERH